MQLPRAKAETVDIRVAEAPLGEEEVELRKIKVIK
jgi:hypothetical protein